ncbi:hypothetical protein ACFQX7_10460 [Luedemannella flava]|uniref:hypothetical protein n=1 Tax=Luedemannella flava TaxID=349316 RepID=UPI0031E32EF0
MTPLVIQHEFLDEDTPRVAATQPPATQASGVAPSGPAAPLTVGITAGGSACFGGWLVGQAPGAIAAPSVGGADSAGWDQWARGVGGIPATAIFVRLDLQGLGEAEVMIHDIRPVVVARDAPVSGTLAKPQCGGDRYYRLMVADLDQTPPARTYELDEDLARSVPPQERRPIRFPYGVSLKESESILVIGTTNRHDVRWRIEIDWSSQGRTGTYVADRKGQPFRVTGAGGAIATCLWGLEGGLMDGSAPDCPG